MELVAGLLGVQPGELEAPDARLLQQLLLSPNEQVRELQAALAILTSGGDGGDGGGDPAVAREMTAQVGGALLRTSVPAARRWNPACLLGHPCLPHLGMPRPAGRRSCPPMPRGADPPPLHRPSPPVPQVVDSLMARAAGRLGVQADTLFPMRASLLSLLQRPQ